MSINHVVGYSKSTRAKCHAPGPCKNTPMAPGTLRYGTTVTDSFGESVSWRHWGCVTPQILSVLATIPLQSIGGFSELNHADQQKIRLAITLRRVDIQDVPPSARVKPAVLPALSTQRTQLASTAALTVPSQRAQTSIPPTERKRSATQANLTTGGSTSNTSVEEDQEFEEEIKDELYCELLTSVVGIQYYRGMVGPGEEVTLVREPHNQFDRNAIQVKNISREQVGHLPRNVVSKLSPLLDKQVVTVEGVMRQGNLTESRTYTLSMMLKIYGPSDKRRELEPALIWATPGQRGFKANRTDSTVSAKTSTASASYVQAIPSSRVASSSQLLSKPTLRRSFAEIEAVRKQQEALQKAIELRNMLNSLEKVDDEGRRSSLLDTLCPVDDILTLPLHPNPPGVANGQLRVDLLKHQLQALQWCIDRENPTLPKKEADRAVQFWQMRTIGTKSYYYNVATKTPQDAPPSLGRGALCADAMGLGKTLTMIALVLATRQERDLTFSQSTLIVVPLSVLSNWEKQIEDHCTPGTISYCVYHGTSKGVSTNELEKHDVVVTTYQTVAGEYNEGGASRRPTKKKKITRSLYEIKWKRIILDEGHSIRNPKTKTAKAVTALQASRRWVLSGTPIINSPRDLGSILSFLQICKPLDNEEFFKRLLLRPLKNGETSGAELLRALMSNICIRRTKEMQDVEGNTIISLPPVEMIRVPVELNDEARKLYDEFEQISQRRIQAFMQGHITASMQSNVLSMLTRMRQIALHPGLVPVSYLDELRNVEVDPEALTPSRTISPEEKVQLQARLAQAIEECEECPICFGILPNDARISSCSHIFCSTCITEAISHDPKCPMDRRQLSAADIFEPPPPLELTQHLVGNPDSEFCTGRSSKIEQLIDLLKICPLNDKALVFSQFTTFLDKIADELQEAGIPFVRFDGRMSVKKRETAISRFSMPLRADSTVTSSQSPSHRLSAQMKLTDEDDQGDDRDDDFQLGDSESQTRAGVPRVMLLSLKAGALGLNLTVANHVFLMDPWWQEGIESQAIDRVNRIGQQKSVRVYQLIADKTVESKVLEIQDKKKQLIQHAFSGMKRVETQRQQREARLQDLIELFGIQRTASQAS